MRLNMVGAFIRNAPFGTEIAFKKGLELEGHHITCVDTSYPDQIWDHDADATIVFKWMEGYWEDLKSCRGVKIVYQPDDIRFPHIAHMMKEMRSFCDYAFTFDDTGADLALGLGYRAAETLLLTADPDLYRHIPELTKDIDVCFIGSLTGGANHKSRVKMCQIVDRIMSSHGLRAEFISDLYDIQKLVEVYNRSKIVLNHATDVGQPFGQGYGYQCRHFEAGLTKACVLSNEIIGPNPIKNFVRFSSEREMVTNLVLLLQENQLRQDVAENFYQELNSCHRPEHRARQIVEFIGNLT